MQQTRIKLAAARRAPRVTRAVAARKKPRRSIRTRPLRGLSEELFVGRLDSLLRLFEDLPPRRARKRHPEVLLELEQLAESRLFANTFEVEVAR